MGTDHPFPNVTVEDRGHGRGVSHIQWPNGSWQGLQHNLDNEFTDACLDSWWAAWMEHGSK